MKLVTGGTVERVTFDAAMTPIGVFMVSYTDSTLGKVFQQSPRPAADDIMACVIGPTDVLFKAAVVSSGATIGDLAQTDIGANVAGVDNTGSTVTGNSVLLFLTSQPLPRYLSASSPSSKRLKTLPVVSPRRT